MEIVVNTILKISSPGFGHMESIPSRYTCTGKNISPELNIGNIPAEAKSLALLMEDPDAGKDPYVHWIMWDISPVEKIEENSAPGVQGRNSKNENKYAGPCPPGGTHHYHFRFFALDVMLTLAEGSGKQDLIRAMEGHILGSGELVGIVKK